MSKFLLTVTSLLILFNTYPLPVAYHAKGNFYRYGASDTIPAPNTKKIQSAEKQTEALKKGFLKKIAKALRFKKNITANRRAFILKTVGELHFNDTIAASSERIIEKINTISDTQEVRFETFKNLIDSIMLEVGKKPDVVIKPPSKPDVAIDSAVKNQAEGFEDELNESPSFIKERAANDKEKRIKLSWIRQIMNSGNRLIASKKEEDGSTTVYQYSLKKKAEICGYYNALLPLYVRYPPIDLLSTLIYDSLFGVNNVGSLIKFTSRKNDQLIRDAKGGGVKIIYSILTAPKVNLDLLLNNMNTQNTFVNEIRSLRDSSFADGININFLALSNSDRVPFTQFVMYVSTQLKKYYPKFKIFLTVPAFDQQRLYDFKALDAFVDNFCIDFSVNRSAKAAPLVSLSSNQVNSLSTSLSYYLNQKVDSKKFIVNFGYRGTRWIIYGNATRPDKFQQYLTYQTIKNKTNSLVYYDEENTSAYIDTIYNIGIKKGDDLKARIWFDDENTLSPKYDFILDYGVGIGFSYLGYDGIFGELSDLLTYKFISVDTVTIKEQREINLSFIDKIRRRFTLYQYIIQNPCQTCFENKLNLSKWDSVAVYVKELEIDSVLKRYNKEVEHYNVGKDEKSKHRKLTTFLYVTKELNNVFFFITLFFILLIVVASIKYIHSIRIEGDDWKHKKMYNWILLGLTVLFLWSVFNFLFTNDLIPFFGVTTGESAGAIKYIKQTDGRINCLPVEDCINIPLQTLEGIILVALLVGIVLANYLILPLLQKDDVT